ncbi:MAG: hypothetical protein ACRDGH_07055 [Candidatus Limnocylindria bacterium]
MQPWREFLRIAVRSLLVVCITLLVVHGLTGHAHVDLLASVPVAEHVPGDDHHEATGGSCEIARTPSQTVAVAISTAVRCMALLGPPSTATAYAFEEDPPATRPPLFLLHASLLI